MTIALSRDILAPGRDGFLEVEGVRLEARFLGPDPAAAPTLVFLHEGLGSAALWKDLPERVSGATGCGVLMYSRHGYGTSTRKPHPWPETYLHDEALYWLPRVLEAANVRRAILVGHSDGGSISAIAAGAGVVPQVEGVVLMAPHVMVEPATLAGVNGAIEAFEKGRLRDHLARYHHNVDDAFWGWAKAWTQFGDNGWDVRSLLPGIRVPVLVLQGDDDEYGSAAQYESIREAVSAPVEVRVLPHCRHLLYRDAPFEVVGALTAFVSAVVAG
ncbi:MAG TPA: alpha/beta hydrolase [Magnetospirillum sp.]|jgi:pimeloyl-ACP methyl ester carboxylesterase|nr:alpha/beta hydrolase [Magnetospirillum sp.]HVI85397.1 alpha/beta hydrolase [bacterium]